MPPKGRQSRKEGLSREIDLGVDREGEDEENVGIFWLTCVKCRNWEIWENTGLPGRYSKEKAKKAKFTCRNCSLQRDLDQARQDLSIINDKVIALEKDLGISKKSYAETVK